MDEQNLQILQEIMDKLQSLMEPSEDELGERLGRPKVEIAVESEAPMEGDDVAMDGDMEMEAPEDKLKQRLMKLRG